MILTLNAGSSSLKFAVFRPAEPDPVHLLSGRIEALSSAPELVIGGDRRRVGEGGGVAHSEAISIVLGEISDRLGDEPLTCVGHRIVHGGPDIRAHQRVTTDLVRQLRGLVPLAPLHQPYNLAGFDAVEARYPGIAQVACFDTAFHRTQPWVNDTFALPKEFYDEGVRRYGFHGLSYDYISGYLGKTYPELHSGRVIAAHLGAGASICALDGGRSIASTMGFTALDGLPMATRSGQIDPGVLLYLLQEKGFDVGEVENLLYRRSGLLGLSGLSGEMRVLEAAGSDAAHGAIAYFTTAIRREFGALAALLGGLDAVVFTGGIGENSARIRRETLEGTEWLGISVSEDANLAGAEMISADGSAVKVLVVATNEELVIARAAQALCS